MITARLVAGLTLVGLVVLLLLIGPAACNRIRSMAAQNRLQQGQTAALSNSAADAVQTQGQANARERQSDDLTRTNEMEIRNAKGADATVDPGVRDAGLRSLCRRASYHDSERCKLFDTPAR